MKRPWLGQTEPPQSANLPSYDPNCYLCPGNSRSGDQRNPDYKETFTFENDFAAILHSPIPSAPLPVHPLMTVQPIHGACDVLTFHPRHDLTMALLSQSDIKRIINEWIRLYEARGSQPGIQYVQIFEVWHFLIVLTSSDHPNPIRIKVLWWAVQTLTHMDRYGHCRRFLQFPCRNWLPWRSTPWRPLRHTALRQED